jgi:transporter family protein
MSWILLSICSAVFLGFYDLAKKHALKGNAVFPVLFFSIVTSACVWLPFVIWSTVSPETFPSAKFQTTAIGARAHGLLFLKSAIVASSWIFGYFAIKHLPLSIAGPIRATSPLWTILLAVFLMGESPSNWQCLGITIVLGAFYAFSFVGKLENIHFSRNKPKFRSRRSENSSQSLIIRNLQRNRLSPFWRSEMFYNSLLFNSDLCLLDSDYSF